MSRFNAILKERAAFHVLVSINFHSNGRCAYSQGSLPWEWKRWNVTKLLHILRLLNSASSTAIGKRNIWYCFEALVALWTGNLRQIRPTWTHLCWFPLQFACRVTAVKEVLLLSPVCSNYGNLGALVLPTLENCSPSVLEFIKTRHSKVSVECEWSSTTFRTECLN